VKAAPDSISVRQGHPDDWEAILEVTAESFLTEANTFVQQWPHSYFGPAAARNFVVCERGRRVIGAINQVPIVIRLGSARLRVSGLCGVCTKPDERGRGVLRAMMNASLRLQQRRVPAVILWGARDLYHRFGFETAGTSCYVAVTRRMVNGSASVPLRRLTSADAGGLLRLARRRPGRVVRSQSWQERLLRSERYETYGNAGGELSAYLVYVAAAPFKDRIVEALGEPDALAGLLAGFVEQHDLEQVWTWFPPGTPLGKAMALKAEKTFAARVESLCATHLCILDFPRLLQRLSIPLAQNLRRCLGAETLRVKCEPDPRAWLLRVTGERLAIDETAASGPADLVLDRTRWVRLLFPSPGSDLMDADFEPGLREAFRLPFVYPPWDIV